MNVPIDININFSDGGSTTLIPELATWAMMLLGFVGLGYDGLRVRRPKVSET